ncbi:hypothetical protein ASPCAL06213 [Aspergillus calidoustus]|uniref:Zn(2)-C6 fungal-type domain-containing protein n=1 Tax=Aspergillus calidoustus TaxID=454130 RepID=A0A0U4Z5Q5_ASPCI|nr:hypothetical protein ASPCAL06213 [Aspergillus calidoustus]
MPYLQVSAHLQKTERSSCLRVRKVKCDESFPVCQRCLSTGRVCDGYGVWGGGGNDYGRRPSPKSPPATPNYPPLACISTCAANTDEKASFDWFRRRTMVKIPGSYLSDFWTTILLQASQSDQAVWHSILALSTTHQSGFVQNFPSQRSTQEQSTLRHLIRAVRHLGPHFSVRDKASCRVILIVCLVFVVLDLLRGHFASAQVHLRNGLNILAQTQSSSIGAADPDSDCSPTSSYAYEPIDVSIGEAFFRLHIQLELLQHQHCPRPCILPLFLQPSIHDPFLPIQFPSYTAAWHGLDHLMNLAFDLSAQARDHAAKAGVKATPTDTLLAQQRRLNSGLDSWLISYNSSIESLQLAISDSIAQAKTKVHHLVSCYHTMLTIMAETALSPNETVFDGYTHQFEQMLVHLADLWTISYIDLNFPSPSSSTPSPSNSNTHSTTSTTNMTSSTALPATEKKRWIGGCDMSHTIIDVGWMIPLFYTAIKCRVRRIRRRAIQLIESSNHREGIWDAKITACIARRVVAFEEGDFYDVLDIDSGRLRTEKSGSRLASRGEGNADEPLLPESCRIRDLEVRMEGDPVEKVVLFAAWDGVEGTVCMGEYNVHEQCWV